MQIFTFDHLQKWIFHFMKPYKQLHKFNAIWLCIAAYHDFTSKQYSYKELSQWNRKEINGMSEYLLGVVTWSLRGGSPAQCLISNHPSVCSWALLQFYMYAQYKSDDDATFSQMEDALSRFDTFKHVFLLG
jgi:hypothetical protein